MTGVELFYTSRATDVLSDKGQVCAHCQRVSFWFRNQDGSSSCISCSMLKGESDDL